jgi:aspartate aminotransferase
MSFVSVRARGIKPSATLTLTAKAKTLSEQGRPVISFAAGEPDFDSPEVVKDAARAAIAAGHTKYAPVGGYLALREAVIADLEELSGVRRSPDEVLVSCGAKHVLYNLIQATINPGDAVIYAAPYWVSYPSMIAMAGGRSVVIQTSSREGFRLDPKTLDNTLAESGAKLVIINSPQNPTGVVYSPVDIDAIVEACVRHKALLISDEIYARLNFSSVPHRSAMAIDDEERRKHVIVVNGVSKSLAMTGWRIGYAMGPKDIIDAAKRIQSHSTSGANSIAQYAAIAGLRAGQECVNHMLTAFKTRRDVLVEELSSIPKLELAVPQGAFYAFPEVSAYCNGYLGETRIESDFDLTDALLNQANIACVPGTPFGTPGYLRLSFALGLEDIREGLRRLKEALGTWREA